MWTEPDVSHSSLWRITCRWRLGELSREARWAHSEGTGAQGTAFGYLGLLLPSGRFINHSTADEWNTGTPRSEGPHSHVCLHTEILVKISGPCSRIGHVSSPRIHSLCLLTQGKRINFKHRLLLIVFLTLALFRFAFLEATDICVSYVFNLKHELQQQKTVQA